MITITGMINWEPSLLRGVDVSELLDIDIFERRLIMKCGTLYPEYQQPDFLKQNISDWWTIRLPAFLRMKYDLTIDFSPIENFDRYEEMTTSRDEDYTTTNRQETSTESESSQSANDTTTGKVSAMDSASFQNKEQNESYSGGSGEASSSATNEGEATNKGSTEEKHIGHLHGNIGVTTSTALISEDLLLREKNLYDMIIAEFENTFLLGVY